MHDVLRRKAVILERCVARVRDKYRGNEPAVETDVDLQDIIVLNLQRACRMAIDMVLGKAMLQADPRG